MYTKIEKKRRQKKAYCKIKYNLYKEIKDRQTNQL